MVKAIGHKIDLFNGYCRNETGLRQMKEACLDVHIELVAFYTDVIKLFRSGSFGELMTEIERRTKR